MERIRLRVVAGPDDDTVAVAGLVSAEVGSDAAVDVAVTAIGDVDDVGAAGAAVGVDGVVEDVVNVVREEAEYWPAELASS